MCVFQSAGTAGTAADLEPMSKGPFRPFPFPIGWQAIGQSGRPRVNSRERERDGRCTHTHTHTHTYEKKQKKIVRWQNSSGLSRLFSARQQQQQHQQQQEQQQQPITRGQSRTARLASAVRSAAQSAISIRLFSFLLLLLPDFRPRKKGTNQRPEKWPKALR